MKKIEEMIYYEKWRWHLVYQLSRNKVHQEKIEIFCQEIIDHKLKLIDNLNVIARWAELLTR